MHHIIKDVFSVNIVRNCDIVWDSPGGGDIIHLPPLVAMFHHYRHMSDNIILSYCNILPFTFYILLITCLASYSPTCNNSFTTVYNDQCLPP